MAQCTSDHLDQFYDVIRVDLRLEREADGWYLHELHRHETGQMGRCLPTTYGPLTAGEALDVLDAVGFSLLPSATQLGQQPS